MRETLTALAQTILQERYGIGDVSMGWELPQDASHGDLATPVALQVAKSAGAKPADIAQVVAEGLASADGVHKAEVAGPGYVNVWLTPGALLSQLNATREACTAKVTRSDEAPVVIDYSSPNIAKPLGIHHILSTVIGQVLANLYRHQGFAVVGVNHIGDWGTQYGKLYVAVQKWGDGRPAEQYSVDELLDLYVRFHDEAETQPELEDEARVVFRQLEEGDETIRTFWEATVKTSLEEIERVYERLSVHLDHVHGESFYEEKMMSIVDEGKEKEVFKEGEKGALIAEFPEASKLPPALVLKSDGATIYHTRDLAVARYRIDTWHPQSLLYVVDVSQQLYFQQLFGMLDQLGWDLPHKEHVIFGRMRFADKKMSTRKGNIVKLTDVLDEAIERAEAAIAEHGEAVQTDDAKALADMMGIGAVVYGILSQNRKMDIVFDWERMLSFDGNSAPYLQYTHARARSVIRKAELGSEPGLPEGISELTERERTLVNALLQFPDVLEEARAQHMPHLLTNYLYALCQDYNAFYNAEPILQADEPQRELRLHLTAATADVLQAGAALLTIRVPDRM